MFMENRRKVEGMWKKVENVGRKKTVWGVRVHVKSWKPVNASKKIKDREHSNIKGLMSVHRRAQCYAKWQRGQSFSTLLESIACHPTHCD